MLALGYCISVSFLSFFLFITSRGLFPDSPSTLLQLTYPQGQLASSWTIGSAYWTIMLLGLACWTIVLLA